MVPILNFKGIHSKKWKKENKKLRDASWRRWYFLGGICYERLIGTGFGWSQHRHKGVDRMTHVVWFSVMHVARTEGMGRRGKKYSWLAQSPTYFGGLWDSSKGWRINAVENRVKLKVSELKAVILMWCLWYLRLACMFLSGRKKWSIQPICQWNDVFVVSMAYFHKM